MTEPQPAPQPDQPASEPQPTPDPVAEPQPAAEPAAGVAGPAAQPQPSAEPAAGPQPAAEAESQSGPGDRQPSAEGAVAPVPQPGPGGLGPGTPQSGPGDRQPGPGEQQPAARSGQWMPRRRVMVVVGAVVLAVALAFVGVAVFVLERAPDTPSEVVTAFLEAAEDGDAKEAASWWMDLEGTRGGKGLRERIQDYVEKWDSLYKEALDGKDLKLKESEARLGAAVEVSVDGRRATYLVVGTGKEGRIALGPEDQFGQSTGNRNPLFVGN